MKVIILLGNPGRRLRPLTWSRPRAMLHVAGNTVLGHILHSLEDMLNEEVIFVVGPKGDLIEEWVRSHYPDLDSHFVTQLEALGPVHAVWCCRDHLRDERQVLLTLGNSIVEAEYTHISEKAEEKQAEAIFLVKEMSDPRPFRVAVQDQNGFVTNLVDKPHSSERREVVVGVNWFRNSRQLLSAVEQVVRKDEMALGKNGLADPYQMILDSGIQTITEKAYQWSDIERADTLLATNARLLSIGLHSADAIERSYAEDFTVLPPVYLHPEATVSSAVIGPYASIAANATISNALVRNSIIDAGTTVTDCVLDGALVGEGARVSGKAKGLMIGDNSTVEI